LRKVLATELARATRDHRRKARDIGKEQPFERSVEESSKQLECFLADDQSSPSERAERNERDLLLAGALESMLEREREAIKLHYVHELSLIEIASEFGWSVDAVGGLWSARMPISFCSTLARSSTFTTRPRFGP
jgi:RNA polymerase sigma factor (sigma-70 family)